ncbi:MFS transporter [Synoicihabitans lomoniglobus]|uniref:MFS transporter n=1 Tax=Synoicihabitans lomoniglobus TaxID=2909285 RepID=A0AAF0CI46_9BACT|nr:MFS transporter [Opitutaceae bacterium LMO-M01]WED64982.1 MFS transporter [Opitutaceae bacterium LMO-M01]
MPLPTLPRLPTNVWVLAVTQAFGMSTVSMMALVAGLLGTTLAPTPKLATLPTAMIVIGTASSMLWVPFLLQAWGRKRGTLVGFAAAFLACGLGAAAAVRGSFPLLLACGYGMGIGIAFWQQLRFAALESVDDPQRYGTVLAVMMMGGLTSAFLGPEMGALGRDLWPQAFAGSFLLVAGLLALGLIAFQFFQEPPRQASTDRSEARPLRVIARSPRFLIAAGSAAVGFAVMSFVMTATPINMHELCGIELADTKRVIQAHIIAMFAPSLASSWLMSRFGLSRMMAMGAGMFGVVVLIGLLGQELMHFWGSLLLLGIGWNFLFVGGTALLPTCYRPSEKFKVQALNDVIVFSTQAIASLSAGWFLFSYGWNIMLFTCMPLVLAAWGLARWLRRVEDPQTRSA